MKTYQFQTYKHIMLL